MQSDKPCFLVLCFNVSLNAISCSSCFDCTQLHNAHCPFPRWGHPGQGHQVRHGRRHACVSWPLWERPSHHPVHGAVPRDHWHQQDPPSGVLPPTSGRGDHSWWLGACDHDHLRPSGRRLGQSGWGSRGGIRLWWWPAGRSESAVCISLMGPPPPPRKTLLTPTSCALRTDCLWRVTDETSFIALVCEWEDKFPAPPPLPPSLLHEGVCLLQYFKKDLKFS